MAREHAGEGCTPIYHSTDRDMQVCSDLEPYRVSEMVDESAEMEDRLEMLRRLR
jgi:hypothetical protein